MVTVRSDLSAPETASAAVVAAAATALAAASTLVSPDEALILSMPCPRTPAVTTAVAVVAAVVAEAVAVTAVSRLGERFHKPPTKHMRLIDGSNGCTI